MGIQPVSLTDKEIEKQKKPEDQTVEREKLEREGQPMKLSPREKDKLLVSLAAMVARGRLGARCETEPSGISGADH